MSVYLKLMKVQTKLKAPKNQRNNFGNYNYRSCEDILEALKPLLEEEKAVINISDNIILIGERYYIESTVKFIDAENGEIIEVKSMAREEENKKGMDSSQLTGSTSSYARKYALNGMFAIDDTKDSDATNTHNKTESKPKQNVSNNNTQSNEKKLSEAQCKRLYSIAYSKNVKSEQVKEAVMKKFGKEISSLTKAEYDAVCKGYEGLNV